MANFYSIITNRGKELEAEALASGSKITLVKFVVGDGNGQAIPPKPTQTKLVNEKYRGDIGDLSVSPEQSTQMMAKIVIPTDVGGFTVREIGILTDAGELYAVANCHAIEKPVGGVSVNMQFRLAVSDTANITLNVATGDGLFLRIDQDLSEIRGRGAQAQKTARESLAVVDASTKQKGLVQLNSATNSTSETQAATPAAVKAVKDSAVQKEGNLSDIADKSKARENLGLVKQTSQTDSTPGAVMLVPAFGLGGTAPRLPAVAGTGYDNIPTNLPTGFYTHQVAGGPFAHSITLRQDGGAATSDRHFIIPSQPTDKIAVRWDSGNTFSYQYLYTDKNKPTASDVEAWPIATRGNIGNGSLLSSANQVGVYLISISKPETVSDFPKIGNTPLYGYGFMFVTKNGASINQLYMSHHGHIANRQSWNNETGYANGWNIGYGTINKPTASDVGALPIGGGALNGNLTVKDTLQIGSVGNAALNIGDNDSGLRSSVDGQVDLYANSKKMGYWNGNILSFTGQVIPTNYTNFDAKYQPKGNYQPAGNYALVGSSYTKVESDTRYYTKVQSDAGYAAQSSVYSKTASDARYVQDIRQSGIMNLAVGSNANTQAPAGGVVIGAIVNGTWDNNEILKYTWLQKNVNGTWLTIGRV